MDPKPMDLVLHLDALVKHLGDLYVRRDDVDAAIVATKAEIASARAMLARGQEIAAAQAKTALDAKP